MHLIAKVMRISRSKFHCNRLTTVQDIQDYASLIQCSSVCVCMCVCVCVVLSVAVNITNSRCWPAMVATSSVHLTSARSETFVLGQWCVSSWTYSSFLAEFLLSASHLVSTNIIVNVSVNMNLYSPSS